MSIAAQDFVVYRSFPPVPESGEVPEDDDSEENDDSDEESIDESTQLSSAEEAEEDEEDAGDFSIHRRGDDSDVLRDTASSGSGEKVDAEEESPKASRPVAGTKRSLLLIDSDDDFVR